MYKSNTKHSTNSTYRVIIMGRSSIKVSMWISEVNGADCKKLDVLEFINPDEAVEILQLKYCTGNKKKKVLISMR